MISKKDLLEENKKLKSEIAMIKGNLNFKDWQQDFGFLTIIINRQLSMNKMLFLDAYIKQLQEKTAMIKDDDLTDSINELVHSVLSEISDSYSTFLINKYFKDKQAFITFVTETIYVEVLKEASAANSDKAKKILGNSNAIAIANLNKKKKE